MNKLPSKWHKNENNRDILLYQIFLHENFFKLNLFKEIVIGFIHSLKMTSESPVSFLNGSFV